jgi:hypothetical protein
MDERKLATEVGKLTNLSPSLTEHVMYLIFTCILHDIACQSLDNSDGKLKSVNINIPYVCDMILSVNNEEVSIESCTFKKDFIKKLNEAVNDGHSCLEDIIKEKLISRINNNYRSLI